MKNLFIGILIGLVVGISIPFAIDQIQTAQTEAEYVDIVDTETIGLAYGVDDPIFELILGNDIYEKIDNEETFVLFIGRQTCPYCSKMLPLLNETLPEFGITHAYYVDSEDTANAGFMQAQEIDAVPFTAFIKGGVVTDYIPGFVEQDVLYQILDEYTK